jgi:tetratricopeptide (TPR) repeat protein
MRSALQPPFRFPGPLPIGGLLLVVCAASQPTPAEVAPEPPGPALAELEDHVHSLLAEDRWREALERAERAHGEAPGEPRTAALLGQALFRAGHFDEIDPLLAPLAEAEEAPPRALLTLARLRYAQGRGRESEKLVERALAAAPRDRELLYWAADVAPDRARTVAWLRRYLELSEGDSPDRIEDAEGTLRVLEQLGDRRVWIPLERPERVELPLRHIWDEGGATVGYVVQAAAGEKGKPLRLLLDTGNHGLYVIHRLARKRGFALLGEATTYGGAGGRKHRVERGVFSSFALGGLRYGDALVTSTREEVEPTGRFHGLLGLSALAGYRVTIDMQEKRLLLDRDPEPLEGEPYWIVAGQVLVRARAAGAEPGLFLLDTGAMRSLLSRSYAEGIDGAVMGPDVALQGLGGLYEGATAVRDVRLEYQGAGGGGTLTAVDTSLRSRMTGVEISGYLGLEILDGTRVVIDTRSRTIRIEK